MAEIMKELDRIEEEERRTTDPAKKQELRYRKAQLREDYRERFVCGLLADAMSDFDLCM